MLSPKIITPLRWTGGKTKAINKIKQYFPTDFDTFYEPFLGGGSIFLYLKQIYPDRTFILNDLNPKVYNVWKWLQIDPEQVSNTCLSWVKKIPKEEKAGRDLFNEIVQYLYVGDFQYTLENAVYFWILNKIQYSGSEKGKFSSAAFGCGKFLNKGPFTETNALKLKKVGEVINTGGEVKFFNKDYSSFLTNANKNDFIFLDPPYKLEKKSNLYGKTGELHKTFDHQRFYDILCKCKAKCLITYDANVDHLLNFDSTNFNINTYNHEYTTVGFVKTKELVIKNF